MKTIREIKIQLQESKEDGKTEYQIKVDGIDSRGYYTLGTHKSQKRSDAKISAIQIIYQ